MKFYRVWDIRKAFHPIACRCSIMVSTSVLQTGYAGPIPVIGFDKNENFCYNIIKEVAERKLFNLIKNKQNC